MAPWSCLIHSIYVIFIYTKPLQLFLFKYKNISSIAKSCPEHIHLLVVNVSICFYWNKSEKVCNQKNVAYKLWQKNDTKFFVVTIWVFKFSWYCHNLSFVPNWVTSSVFEFYHNLSFWDWSQFDLILGTNSHSYGHCKVLHNVH